jgi:hypothetical protein
MSQLYQVLGDSGWIRNVETDTRFHVTSTHLQVTRDYLDWLAAGNVPDPPSEADRELLRARLHQGRRDARTRTETSGFMFNGHPIDSDRDSILRINNAATTAVTSILTGSEFATVWSCADGYEMPLDAQGVLAMQAALSAHGQACHNRAKALKGLIDAPDTDFNILLSEIQIGWPNLELVTGHISANEMNPDEIISSGFVESG